MKNFYFTFGQAHVTTAGIPMQHKWVRVEAEDWNKARETFVEEFSSVEMDAPDKWSHQYKEGTFDPQWFPEGEYLLLTQKDELK